jgi:hypothetical protein
MGAVLSVHQSGSVHGDRTLRGSWKLRRFPPLDGTLPLRAVVETTCMSSGRWQRKS